MSVTLSVCPGSLHAPGIMILLVKDVFVEAQNVAPLLHYRAKHQKLKTGNDQSPGDKKPETEADQRMFDQVLMCSVTWTHYVVCFCYI